MTGTRLGTVLSLKQGLPSGFLSSESLAYFDSILYSRNYTLGDVSIPGSLGPDPSKQNWKGIDPNNPGDETATVYNWGELVAGSDDNILLILRGGYNATALNDATGIYYDQESTTVLRLFRNAGAKHWDVEKLFSYTDIPIIGDGGDSRYAENSLVDFNKLVTDETGSIKRLYKEWGDQGDNWEDVNVSYIDLNDESNSIVVTPLYGKILATGAEDRGYNETTQTGVNYSLNTVRATSTEVYYQIGKNNYGPNQNEYKELIYAEGLNGDNFRLVGEFKLNPLLSNRWNWQWLYSGSEGFAKVENGALAIADVNVVDYDQVSNSPNTWIDGYYTLDLYLTYFDTTNNRISHIDLPEVEERKPGTLVRSTAGAFEAIFERYSLYSVLGQGFVLRSIEDAFNNGNGKFKYEIYGVSYADNGDVELSSVIKQMEFSYRDLGLTAPLVEAINSAFEDGTINFLQFRGSDIEASAIFDKSGSKAVRNAYKIYTRFQAKLYRELGKAIAGRGNDSYSVDNQDILITELDGSGRRDEVVASSNYSLDEQNTIEILKITGTDNYNGTGNGLNNLIMGNSGNNILNGGAGKDKILAAGGDDVLIGGADNDTLDGGSGFDTADYSDAVNSISVRLGSNGRGIVIGGIEVGRDRLISIEAVKGGSGNDSFSFSAERDVVTGGLGVDRYGYKKSAFGSVMGSAGDRIFDLITDFAFGQDLFDLPSLPAIQAQAYLGSFDTPTTITDAQLNSLFASSGLAAGGAGWFTVTNGALTRTFVAVNDKNVSFGYGDFIVEVSGFSGDINQSFASSFV